MADGAADTLAVEVVASGALGGFLPADARGGRARLACPPDSSVADLLATLGIPVERPLLAILDGAVVVPDARADTPLVDGATLSLAPPIRAG